MNIKLLREYIERILLEKDDKKSDEEIEQEEKDNEENEKEQEKTGIPKKLKGDQVKGKPISSPAINSALKQNITGISLQGQENKNYKIIPLNLMTEISNIEDIFTMRIDQTSSMKYSNVGIMPFFVFGGNRIISIQDFSNEIIPLLFYTVLPGFVVDEDNEKMMNKIFKSTYKGDDQKKKDFSDDEKTQIIKSTMESIGFCPIKIEEIKNIQSFFKNDAENKIQNMFALLKSKRKIKSPKEKNNEEAYILSPYQVKYILNTLIRNLQIRFSNQSKEVYKISKNKL